MLDVSERFYLKKNEFVKEAAWVYEVGWGKDGECGSLVA